MTSVLSSDILEYNGLRRVLYMQFPGCFCTWVVIALLVVTGLPAQSLDCLHGAVSVLPPAATVFKAALPAPVFAPAPVFDHEPAFAPASVFSHTPIVAPAAPVIAAPVVKAVAPATSYATVTQVHVAQPILKTVMAPQPIIAQPVFKGIALPEISW
ncbi:hypothetical protein CBL_01525 [Carabus blaptoides fortunei]